LVDFLAQLFHFGLGAGDRAPELIACVQGLD
jgi:hypothetical protein